MHRQPVVWSHCVKHDTGRRRRTDTRSRSGSGDYDAGGGHGKADGQQQMILDTSTSSSHLCCDSRRLRTCSRSGSAAKAGRAMALPMVALSGWQHEPTKGVNVCLGHQPSVHVDTYARDE